MEPFSYFSGEFKIIGALFGEQRGDGLAVPPSCSSRSVNLLLDRKRGDKSLSLGIPLIGDGPRGRGGFLISE